MFMIFLSISLYMSVKNVRNESRKVNVAPPPFECDIVGNNYQIGFKLSENVLEMALAT